MKTLAQIIKLIGKAAAGFIIWLATKLEGSNYVSKCRNNVFGKSKALARNWNCG